MAARARHDPARFCDVRYADFVADPIGTVESVYDRFGMALTGAAADAMRAVQEGEAAAARRGRAGGRRGTGTRSPTSG